MKMKRRWSWALAVMAVVMAFVLPADAKPSMPRDEMSSRLTRKGAAGRIDVRASRKHFPEGAEVSIERARPDDVKRKIHQGWSKRNGRARAPRAPQDASPTVLASYDISIRHGGKKWQPDAGDPVRVTVDLDEPVAVTATSSLGIAHLSDDGAVEELPASRYGFTYNAAKTAVTSFWVDADGFSIYSIVDTDGKVQTARRFYHFYGHPSTDGTGMDIALPYQYRDQSNDVVNVQIVKDGDMLKEPPIPRDIVDENDEVTSIFEGWYVVSSNARPATVVESKLDSTNEYFQFHWPVGVTDMRMSFTNAVTVTETEDWDYYLVPLYENARFLQFNENAKTETAQGAGARIIRRKLVAINDETGEATLKVSDVEAALKNSLDEYFCGWEYLDTDGEYKHLLVYSELGKPQDQFITVDDALFEANDGSVIPLYPYYVSAHFLHFDSNAGGAHAKYVGPVFVRSSSNFSAVETSGDRKGYNFAGWRAGFKNETTKEIRFAELVTDANGNFIPNVTVTNDAGAVAFYTDANGNIRMNEDVTLYGTWAANTDASYRVIIWRQRATDDKNATDAEKKYHYVTHYTSPVVPATTRITESLITSFTGTAAQGTNPNNSNLTAFSGASNITGEDFKGFHYGRWECKDETVAPDASTVINVYYDRDLITIQFCIYQNQAQTVYAVTSSTSGTIYGTDDGENYFEVYYDNGRWYKTRTSSQGYTYSTEHTGARYRKTGNNSYTQVSNTDNEGTQYRKSNYGNNYYEIYYNQADGKWYRERNTGTVYVYSNPYVGTRYTRSITNWVADDAHTFTGLYGQTLAFNGYDWPYSDYWYDGHGTNAGSGTRTTFLDSFMEDKVFYRADATASDSKPVYFYKQTVNGDYEDGEDGQPNNYANTVKVGGNSNFKITDKYSGFKAVQYKADSGSWKDTTVSSSASAITEYDSASFNSQLKIRFERNKHELIYQFTDDNGDHILRDTGKVVPFEAPLTAYNIAYTNLNWTGCDITNRTFAGWYEDASLTKEFDFNGTMPDSKKVIYAKWSPLQHKVIIDPNGGELHGTDSTWFYVDPEKNETIKEYHPTRDYRLDMHNGTYYYHYDPWDPLGDKHVTDTNSPSFIPNISRKAYYTLDIADATSNEYSNPVNRYVYDPGAYAFMGWFEVLADGTLSIDPFSFGEPPTRNVTLRAIWRRMGIYTLKYESIDPDGRQATVTLFDPEHHATGNIEDGYVADAETTLTKAPANYDKEQWLWEGWQVIDTYNNNIPLTTIRSPGDVYIVRASHADLNNVIHLRAVFKHIGDSTSRHVPLVTDLILDSNENAGLAPGAAVTPAPGRVGTYTGGSTASVSGLNQGVWFAGQQNNFSVNLADYAPDFVHNNGYFLLGWDPHRDVSTLIPTYYANETIGIDKETGTENILYAVWEPQIYIEFVNDTGAELSGVQLYIPGWTDGELFRVNSMQDTYRRERFAAFSEGTATFDIPAGDRICLVLPDAAEKDFAVMGACTYAEGNKLVVTRIQPQIAGQETIPDVTQSVYPGENYMVSGTMKVSPTPVQVRFTKATYLTEVTVPVRYFLHLTNTTDGVIREITHDDAYWQTVGGNARATNITVRAADIDLAAALRVNASTSVHGFLADVRPDDGALLREGFRCTTIGIGSATNSFEEYRTITKRDPSGGSYIHYRRESVEWSRYSHVWNAYDDAAVYVVFYRREPVHVTVAKSVTGTEEDKTRKFDFTANFTEKSKTFEYTVTTSYKKTRTIRSNAERGGFLNLSWGWSDTWTGPDWASCEEQTVSVGNPSTPALVSEDQFPFSDDGRESEDISLAHGERHPFTIYYNRLQDTDPNRTVTTGGATSQSSISYYSSNGSSSNSNAGNGKYRTRTETTNYTQTVTYLVTYQYETVTIREKNDPDNLFVLSSIDGDPDNPLVNHNGTANVADRSYTISSLRGPDASGFYDYQLLDTAIFKNARKTGSVKVTKTVVDGDEGDEFPFTVTLGETVINKDTYTPPAGATSGPYGKVFSFHLANGGSMTLTNLPAGASYKVEEGAHAKYVATIPANATGTVEADTTISVGVTNTRKTDIEIVMNSVTNYFNGAEQFGYDISCVTGTTTAVETDAYTVTGLKPGHVLTVEHHVPSHGTAVGEYTGDFSNARYTILDAGGNDVTQEYLVTTPVADTMTIKGTPIIVEIAGNTVTATYDGTEHVCQGYTYKVKNANTDDDLTSAEVYVSVDPNYQQVYRTSVGKVEMPLEGHVNVTVPEGFTLQAVTVVSKGYIEISPAPVTVTANDAEKIAGRNDPALTATVTGLIEGEPEISYSVSRAAGEEVGTYVITASGAALQGNYAVTFVNGTFTIKGLPDLVQRATGTGLEIQVPVTDGLLAAAGIDPAGDITTDAVGDILNAFDPNGLRRWENLVTGTATNQPLLSTKFGDVTDGMALPVGMTAGQENPVDMGYNVLYELRRQTTDGWTRVAGPAETSDSSEFSIELEDGDGKSKEPTGLYRMVTLIVPRHELSITNEIPSTNIIGVLEVDSAITNTVVAVPWKQLASDPKHAGNITVANYVSSLNLTPGDHVYAFEEVPSKGASASGGATYMMWTLQSDGTWTSATTIKSTEAGYSVMSVAEDAETKEFARTQAVWLQRQRPLDKDGKPVPFFLIGQYDADGVEITVKGGTSSEPGYTLLSVPDYRDYSINDLDWSGYASAADSTDFIRVVDGSQSFLLKWSDGKWCTEEVNYRRGRPAGMKYVPYETPFKAGTGFWFCRHGGEFTIKWAPSEEVQ